MSKDKKLQEALGLKIRKDELIERVLMYVKNENLSHTEAILEVCEEEGIDPVDIAKMIKGPLKEKLRLEAVDKNIIKGARKPTTNSLIGDCA